MNRGLSREYLQLNVKAWKQRSDGPVDFTDFPESKYHGLRKKPNTGIVFSGGGSRAYVAAIGYLSGHSETRPH